ncbi:uncharacterized protein [Amphiura filiformis]|uniref:uncharacterized protein n=1 Tax=Amphiura filiformis TaxID=82378 RepID=UPI003B20DC3F
MALNGSGQSSDLNRFTESSFADMTLASKSGLQQLRSREPVENDEYPGLIQVDHDMSFELPPANANGQLPEMSEGNDISTREFVGGNVGIESQIQGIAVMESVNTYPNVPLIGCQIPQNTSWNVESTHVPFEYPVTDYAGTSAEMSAGNRQCVDIEAERVKSLISHENVPDIFQRVAKLEIKTTDQHRVLTLTRDLLATMSGKIGHLNGKWLKAVEGERKANQTVLEMEENLRNWKAAKEQYITSLEQQKAQLLHEITEGFDRAKKTEEKHAKMKELIKTLKADTDKRIAQLQQRNEELENGDINKQKMIQMGQEKLIHVTNEMRMMQDCERKNIETTAKLQQELCIVSNERQRVKCERDHARLQASILKHSKDGICKDRNNWRKKVKELEKKNKTQDLEETKSMFEKQQDFIKETRNQALEIKIKRLQKENSFLKDTIEAIACDNATAVSAAFDAAQPSDVELECFSCHKSYVPSGNNNADNVCCFHPLPPMHFREWSRWPVGEAASLDSDKGKLYWGCCDILSYTRPDGCSHGRHHQSWEVDVVMKQALSRKVSCC